MKCTFMHIPTVTLNPLKFYHNVTPKSLIASLWLERKPDRITNGSSEKSSYDRFVVAESVGEWSDLTPAKNMQQARGVTKITEGYWR